MNDVMVSIRMPKTLVNSLQEKAKGDHFLDLSEFIRGIVREKWEEHQKPYLSEIKSLRKEIGENLNQETEKRVQKEIAEELRKIRDQIKKGGFGA